MALGPTAFVLLLLHLCSWSHGQGNGDESGIGNQRVTDPQSASEFFSARNWMSTTGSASEYVDLRTLLRNFQRYTGLTVTGELDQATINKMNSPKCGNPDFGPEGYTMNARRRKRFTRLGSVTWPQNRVTWFLEGTTNDLSRSAIRTDIQAAFGYWADVSALSFDEVFSSNADIIVNFYRADHGDGSRFDGPGSTLAHAFGPGRGIGGDMHFDDDETFTRTSSQINLLQVAVHEIGHSLGLGHSSDNNAIMAPFYTFRSNLRLGQDDVLGIQTLYGRPTNTATRPPMRTPRPTQPTMPSTPTPTQTIAPLYCNGWFNATTETFDRDGSLFLFQGEDVYKVRLAGNAFERVQGYPRPISEELSGAPNFIDAAVTYEYSSISRYMYIFKGNRYWRYYNGRPSAGYPRNINLWGLPPNIDGAFRWPRNQKIYFFKGTQYWRYNTMTQVIDDGYPRQISAGWTGVISPLTAVLNWGSQSFFFNTQYFQEYSSSTYSAEGNYQAARTFLGCQTEGLLEYGETTTPPPVAPTTESGASGLTPGAYAMMVTSLASIYIMIVN